MSFLVRIRFFQKCVVCIAVFFLGLMFWVAFVSHARKSGSTGMDMGSIQKTRYEEELKKQAFHEKKINALRRSKDTENPL